MSSIDDRFPTQAVPLTSAPEAEPRPANGSAGNELELAIPREGAGRKTKGGGLAWELLQTIVLTLAIFLGVRSLVQNFRVEGASMEPTLTTGQYLLINKAAYFHVEGTPFEHLLPQQREGSADFPFGGPQRGEIVVFRAPTQPDKDFIKRVIGLPGDTILVKNGQVIVNGQPLDEPYIHFPALHLPLRWPAASGARRQLLRAGRQSPQQLRLAPGLVRARREPGRQGLGQLLAAPGLGHRPGRRLRHQVGSQLERF